MSEGKKHAGGRPVKFKEEFCEQALKLCKLGASDDELADFFGVCQKTINNWKLVEPKFLQSIREGKDKFDSDLIESSLKHRASGYSHEEEKIFCSNGEIVRATTTKHYPPDTSAIKLWLTNRDPDRWRDKQELEVSGEMKIMGLSDIREHKKD